MILIGLTGGPGAGKSLAAKYLELKGAVIISGDETGKEVLESSPSMLNKIRKNFGDSYFNADRSLDRKRLARTVFGNSAELKKLNSIVHPPLLRLLKSKINKYKKTGSKKVVVVDAALIYEWGIEDWFDRVLVITASRSIRIARMIQSGLTRKEAENRIRSQIPQRIKAARADFVIENDGGKIALRNMVCAFFAGIGG